jgi:type IV pilus assembly protein PilF
MILRSKTRLVLVLSILSVLGSACSSSPKGVRSLSKQEKIDGLMKIAEAAVTENDPISALETLNQIRELDSSIPRVYYLYSLAYLNKKELALAEDAARRAVKLDPRYTSAKNALGKVLLDRGNLQEAEPLLKEAASDILYRESVLPKINLGILYFKKMDYANSEKWLNAAISEGGPVICMARFYLGRVQLELNQTGKAVKNLMTSIKGACSGISDAHMELGKAFIRQKRYDEARAKFIEIQRLFPEGDTYDQAGEFLRGIP